VLKRKGTPPSRAVAADCYVSIAAEVRRFVAGGTRQFMITSSGPGEGKSSVVYEVARALSRQSELRIVVVDTDQLRPTMHRRFETEVTGGLGELIQRAYGLDLRATPEEFGLGDWIELLQVQGRTGRLAIEEDGRTLVLTFLAGAIVSITDRGGAADRRLGQMLSEGGHLAPAMRDQALQLASQSGEPLGEIALRLGFVEAAPLQAALRAQFSERLQHMLTMRQPRCTFTAATERELGPAIPRDAAAAAGWAKQSGAMLMIRERLKQPFLSRHLREALKRTDVPNLDLMTCGRAAFNLLEGAGPAALRCILEHLATTHDVVLVDSPPVALGSPAEAISEMVGGTILVVQADRFEAAVIRRAKDRLEKRGARLLGVILNQVDLKEPDQSFHYYYLYYPNDGDGSGKRKRSKRSRVVTKDEELTAARLAQLEEEELLASIGIRPRRASRAMALLVLGLVLSLGLGALLMIRLGPWSQHAAPTAGASSASASALAQSPASTSSAAAPAAAAAAPANSSAAATRPSAAAHASVPSAGKRARVRSTAAAAPRPAREPSATARYTISVGTFLEAERADAERRKIDTNFSPLSASVEKISDGGEESFRVLVGNFASHAAAVKAASDLIGTGQVREALVLPATTAGSN